MLAGRSGSNCECTVDSVLKLLDKYVERAGTAFGVSFIPLYACMTSDRILAIDQGSGCLRGCGWIRSRRAGLLLISGDRPDMTHGANTYALAPSSGAGNTIHAPPLRLRTITLEASGIE
jgi:hypothetical protein